MFFYGISADISLGKGYIWTCFEPGCSIVNYDLMSNPSNKRLMSGISGDICELSVSKKYIIGRVCEKNEYSEKHNIGIEGYFILDKINLKKTLGMDKDKFINECKKLKIDDVNLQYSSPIDPVFDPYYWYVILMNKFD